MSELWLVQNLEINVEVSLIEQQFISSIHIHIFINALHHK